MVNHKIDASMKHTRVAKLTDAEQIGSLILCVDVHFYSSINCCKINTLQKMPGVFYPFPRKVSKSQNIPRAKFCYFMLV
ncbi:hypothetical protein BH10PSE19_BH10PSE19_04310 [soil metagenome]